MLLTPFSVVDLLPPDSSSLRAQQACSLVTVTCTRIALSLATLFGQID